MEMDEVEGGEVMGKAGEDGNGAEKEMGGGRRRKKEDRGRGGLNRPLGNTNKTLTSASPWPKRELRL
jgi:hypothetical protein